MEKIIIIKEMIRYFELIRNASVTVGVVGLGYEIALKDRVIENFVPLNYKFCKNVLEKL